MTLKVAGKPGLLTDTAVSLHTTVAAAAVTAAAVVTTTATAKEIRHHRAIKT